MTYNFNTEPYFDDFDELNNYLKVLFRPGYAVQARELTQLQTILQNQSNSIAKHLFKSGTSIIDGRLDYQPKSSYIKILSPGNYTLSDLKSAVFTGQTSGVKGVISYYDEPNSTYTDSVIYVKYVSGGVNDATTFQANENLVSADGNITLTTQDDASGNVVIGEGSLISISNGIYYVDGHFITVNKETLILDRYNTVPSYIVGLKWTDDIISSNEDTSLNDNATGSPNYAAPGAHRYKISGSLAKFNFTDTTDKPNFIKLWSVEDGFTVSYEDKTDYNQIEDFIAQRTYEESGNYVAKDFHISLHEQRDNYIETWIADSDYIIGDVLKELDLDGNKQFYICTSDGTSGSTKPIFPNTFSIVSDNQTSWKYSNTARINHGLYDAINDDIDSVGYDYNYILKISGGIGIVRGHTLRQSGQLRLQNTKSRSYALEEAGVIEAPTPEYILVQDPSTFPDDTGVDFIDISIYSEFSTVHGTPPVGQTKIGTGKARWIEKHTDGIDLYRLYTHDIIMDAGYSFTRNAKSLYSQNTGALDFTGNITQEYSLLSGNVSGTVGTPYINGAGTSFDTELSVGDYVTADNINYYKITVITSGVLTVSTNLTVDIVTSTFRRVDSQITQETSFSVFSLQHEFIKNLKSADQITSDTSYSITRRLGNQTTTAGNTDLSFILSGDDTFSPTTPQNYTIIETLTGLIITSHTISRSSDVQTLTIGNLTPNTQYTVYATILRSETVAVDKQILVGTLDVTTSNDVNAALILLGKADCTKLLEVKVADAFGTINAQNLATTDITNLFRIDTGQKTLYYDVGSIEKNRNEIVNGSIRIYFEYFDHINAVSRDYFSVESYGSMDYNNIDPDLRDSMDFRPIKNDNGIGFKNVNFGIIKPDTDIHADYAYYVPRLDYLVLTPEKELKILRGSPGLDLNPPSLTEGAMVLYEIINRQYGGTLNDIILNKMSINRYTMEDINTLSKRIDNLEYYTSLSLSEASVVNLDVLDENGLTLFKNGFVVDSFHDMELPDFRNIDHMMNIETTSGMLRPVINSSVITLKENGTILDRINSGYVVNSGVVTLPYEEIEFIKNEYASRVVNVNPFNVIAFQGIIDIYPSSDIWIDEVTLPTIKDKNY